MATHYTVIIYDDFLGIMNGMSIEEEAENLTKALSMSGAVIFNEFKPICDVLVGELRRIPPNRYRGLFKRYDEVHFIDDSKGYMEKLEINKDK